MREVARGFLRCREVMRRSPAPVATKPFQQQIKQQYFAKKMQSITARKKGDNNEYDRI
jgi:hypothetical protein